MLGSSGQTLGSKMHSAVAGGGLPMTSDRTYKPTYLAERRVEGQRLAYYMTTANPQFWDHHWQVHFSPQVYSGAERGALGWFEEPFTR